MPTRYAIATGNWSNPAIWDDGIGPVAGDDVYSNGFTITIDTNVNVGSIRNTPNPVYIPTNAIPDMTGINTPSGLALSSGDLGGNFSWFAFDQNLSSGWQSSTNNGVGWVGYQFPTGKIIKRYAFYTPGATNVLPRTWTFEGSNNGSTWTVLDTQTLQSLAVSSWYTYALANTTSYTYYRMNVSVSSQFGPQIIELQMTESTSTTFAGNSGGAYILNGGVTVTANVAGLIGGGTTLMTYSAASGNTSVLNIAGLSTTNTIGINHVGTGTLNITSATGISGNANGTKANGTIVVTNNGTLNLVSSLFSATGDSAPALYVSLSATVNITGSLSTPSGQFNATGINAAMYVVGPSTVNIVGTISSNASTNFSSTSNYCGLFCNAAANITITGNAVASAASSSSFCNPIYMTAGNLTITGTLTGNGASQNSTNGLNSGGAALLHIGTGTINVIGNCVASVCPAVSINGGSVLTITGSLTASTSAPALTVGPTSTIVNLTGPFINNNNGLMAVYLPRMFLTSTPTYWGTRDSGGTARFLYTADFAPNFPAVGDVRFGTSYNGGLMVGTMNVPNPGVVTAGVSVGTTVGTALFDTTSISNAVWNTLLTNITTPNTIGIRVKNSITQDTLANLLTSL